MITIFYFIASIVILGALFIAIKAIGGAYLKYRGTRVITCPETRKPVAVNVDVKHAAFSAIGGDPDLRLRSCTRWPERQDCDQDCLLQIELNPKDCLVRNMLTNWYEGKKCVFCHQEVEKVNWHERKPALLSPDNKTVQCNDVPPESLPEVLSTHKPV